MGPTALPRIGIILVIDMADPRFSVANRSPVMAGFRQMEAMDAPARNLKTMIMPRLLLKPAIKVKIRNRKLKR